MASFVLVNLCADFQSVSLESNWHGCIKMTKNKPRAAFKREALFVLSGALVNAFLRNSSSINGDDIDHFLNEAEYLVQYIEQFGLYVENSGEIVEALTASQDLVDLVLRGHILSPEAGLAERARRASYIWNNEFLRCRLSKTQSLMKLINGYDCYSRPSAGKHPFDESLDEALKKMTKISEERTRRRSKSRIHKQREVSENTA